VTVGERERVGTLHEAADDVIDVVWRRRGGDRRGRRRRDDRRLACVVEGSDWLRGRYRRRFGQRDVLDHRRIVP